jgi:hypothetical protein
MTGKIEKALAQLLDTPRVPSLSLECLVFDAAVFLTFQSGLQGGSDGAAPLYTLRARVEWQGDGRAALLR